MAKEEEKEKEKREVPIQEEDFAAHLKKYRVKPELAETIAENIARTGGLNVFEQPEVLSERLTTWASDITPPRRKQMLEHWFAERRITVPPDVAERIGLGKEEIKFLDKDQAKRKHADEGKVWYVESDGGIRMIKPGEDGVTLDEAERAAKRIRKEVMGTEEPVIFDEKAGRFVPNPRSEFVQRHPYAAMMTAKEMGKLMSEEGEADPFDVMTLQMEKVDIMREKLHGKTTDEKPSTIVELVDAMAKLDELRGGKGKGETDTIDTFIKLQELTAPRQDALAKEIATLAEAVKTKPGESEETKAMREQINALRQSIDTMRDEQKQAQLDSLKTSYEKSMGSLQGEIASLRGEVERQKRDGLQLNEFGIMSKGLDVVDRRLGAIESVVKGWSAPKLPGPTEVAEMKVRLGQAAETEAALDKLADELGFYKGQQ